MTKNRIIVSTKDKTDIPVISYKNLPQKSPLQFTAIVWLLLDRYNPSQIIWGIVLTLVAIIWMVSLLSLLRQEQFNIFEKKDEDQLN